MIVSHKSKLIFIHVHRTGGTSLSNIFQSYLHRDCKLLPQHMNAKNLSRRFLEKHKGYYTFGFTRNPWERIWSWYALIHKNSPKSLREERNRLEEFIESDVVLDFRYQFFHYNTLDYFSTNWGETIWDRIYRYEDFEDEVRALSRRLKVPLHDIPKLNKSVNQDYKDYYTDKSYELIATKCQKDIEYFNYQF